MRGANQGGFTLIELVIVIVILGILAAVAIPQYVDLADEAEAAVCEGATGALTSSAAIQLAANDGTPQTRANVIAATTADGWEASASSTAGVITVSVPDEATASTTCDTIDLQAAGLTSD